MKTNLLSIILIFCFVDVFGVNSLRVGDPRNTWQTYQGTIEEASLTVSPKGLFMQFDLYLTFSSKGTDWTSEKDTLEVTLDFELPENSMITDSWLWFGNDTIKAVLTDRWTASSIYESIVKRRRDPSVLFKQYENQYQLRVFPMAGNEKRKVKISYLVPVNWYKTNIAATLPLKILNTSLTLPPVLKVFTWENSYWKNAMILNDESLVFKDISDDIYGNCSFVEVPSSKFESSLKIAFDTPQTNGFFFSKFQNGNEGYYQMAISPVKILNINAGKKIAVCVEYKADNTTLKNNEILSLLKEEMQNSLTSADSFNLILSGKTILRHNKTWVQATYENIESAFHILGNQLNDYTDIAALLKNGIEFINETGNSGKIVLVSNSDEYTDYASANQIINELQALMNVKIPIHIVDYQSLYYRYYFTDQYQYINNGYFYANLAKLTGGSYQSMQNGNTETEIFHSAFKYASGSINSFDLHTSLENGFTYSRYNLNKDENVAYLNEMILQVGRFKGDFPFKIEFSGEYNNELFSQKFEFKDDGKTFSDSVIQQIWAGTYISKMETSYSSNDIINNIIDESINNSVLSLYTSFLCLEDTTGWCLNCETDKYRYDYIDVPIMTTVIESNNLAEMVSVYPNPFHNNLNIEIRIDKQDEVQDMAVYDLKGALVYKFDKNEFLSGNTGTINWNGRSQNGSDLIPGIYMLVLKTSKTSKTIKLVKQ